MGWRRLNQDSGRRDLRVYLSAHAEQQLEVLGPAAAHAVDRLRSMDLDEIEWLAEPLPPQRGREMWLLWDREVRVLFDVEDSDLTVQGIGLRPPRHGARRPPLPPVVR